MGHIMLRINESLYPALDTARTHKRMISMANVFDVAQYIVDKTGKISSIMLQKLVYYSKAWSLVWDEDPLFSEEVQAWANGPVVPKLHEAHGDTFFSPMTFEHADPGRLTEAQKKTIDRVIEAYSSMDLLYLVAMSHSEIPWRNARGELREYEIGTTPIPDDEIAEYFSALNA